MSLIGNEETNQSTSLDSLVGEGKQYKTVEALVAGKLEGDRYIQTLKEELDAEKEKVAKADHAKELLEKLQEEKAQAQSAVPAVVPDPTLDQNTSGSLSEEDLKALVTKTLEETNNAVTEAANVRTVNETLIARYGDTDKAQEAIKAKSVELDVTTEYLEDVAKGNPAVFFKLISDGTRSSTPSHDASSFRSGTNSDRSQVKDWAFYTKLRKENPALYRSPETRKEMDDAMVEMGSQAFFGR
jgi:hypothetical protein